MKTVSIIVSSYSEIISAGLSVLISSLHIPGCQVHSIRPDRLESEAGRLPGFRILFIDTSSAIPDTISRLSKNNCESMPMIGIYHSAIPVDVQKRFADTLSIYGDISSFRDLIGHIVSQQNQSDEATDELTPREKEILIAAVKGLSNKEIASEFNVSVNTVMTHRRNIASKLQIHSVAGLMIYAIVSKLVSVDDIKSGMR